MLSAEIVDPAKVVRVALLDAASIAGLLITTEAMVAEAPKRESTRCLEAAAAWASWEGWTSRTLGPIERSKPRGFRGFVVFAVFGWQSPNASGKLVLGCASIGHRLGLSPLRARIFGARRETIVRAVRPCDPPVGELPAHLTRAATVVRGADVNAGHAGTCRSAFRAHDPKKRTFVPSSTAPCGDLQRRTGGRRL